MKTKLFLLASLYITTSACVSSSKMEVSQASINKLQKDIDNYVVQLSSCNSQVKALVDEQTNLQNDNVMALNELKELSKTCKTNVADEAKRLKNLQTLMTAQNKQMANVKDAIANALMNFKSDEINIYFKDGNVYISMEEKLLFKSGSDVVDVKGIGALKSLAQVLKNTKDINVVIEGHSDTIPIKTTQFKDNWDLSTARATAIVRILTLVDGFDSERITASGRSKFHPIKSNATAEGRAANRRTEVILSPDLKGLFQLLY